MTHELTQTAPAMHTPGDWRLDIWEYPGANPPRKDLVICNEQKLLATVAWDEGAENPYTIPQHEALANAALMKAAPKILESLSDVMGWFDSAPFRRLMEKQGYQAECSRIINAARTAIALAENRTA